MRSFAAGSGGGAFVGRKSNVQESAGHTAHKGAHTERGEGVEGHTWEHGDIEEKRREGEIQQGGAEGALYQREDFVTKQEAW